MWGVPHQAASSLLEKEIGEKKICIHQTGSLLCIESIESGFRNEFQSYIIKVEVVGVRRSFLNGIRLLESLLRLRCCRVTLHFLFRLLLIYSEREQGK